MTTSLRLHSLLSLVVLPVCTAVIEMTQNYDCTDKLHLESEYAFKNPDCDHYLSEQDDCIGTILKSEVECHSPCKELSAGRIVLDKCTNVTLTVICSKEYLTENRIHFNGIMMPQSLYEQEKREYTVTILSTVLVVLVIACLFAKCLYKCYRSNAEAAHPDPV